VITRTLRCGLAVAAMGVATLGWAQNYAQSRVQIKAGILYTKQGKPATPHVFYNLNRETSLKPAGWEFVNPRSSSVMNDNLTATWFGDATLTTNGTRVDKSQAGYWQVDLDGSSDTVLGSYDVLMLPVGSTGVFRLSPSEREKLRKFVDQGGTLWIDFQTANNGNIDFVNPSPASLKLGAGAADLFLNDAHPLINTPQLISYEEIDQLRFGRPVLNPVAAGDLGGAAPYNQWLSQEFGQFSPVAGNSTTSLYVATRKLGDGTIVASTLGLGTALNGALSNTFYMAQNPTFGSAFYAAEKFVINMVSLNNGYSTSLQGSRHSSSSPVSVNAPMLRRYTVNGTPDNSGAVLFKGRLVEIVKDVSAGTIKLTVMDAQPGNDLDGDGNPDDGIPDGLNSEGRDVIWEATVPANCSALTCTEVNGRDLILFNDPSGNLNVFTLTQANNASPAPYATVAPPVAPDTPSTAAPTVHEGVAYVVDSISTFTRFGRTWAVDLTGAVPSKLQGANGDYVITRAAQFNGPSGPATVGYIPILDNAGGVDKVAYVPMVPDPGAQRSAGLCSIWLGTKGEKPRTIQAGTTLTIQPRALDQQCAIDVNHGFKMTFVHVAPGAPLDGVPFTEAEMNAALSGPPTIAADGQITVTLTNAATYDFSDSGNTGCRLDYNIDWSVSQSGTSNPDTYVRGNVYFPDNSERDLEVKGGVAMSSKGNLFVAVGHKTQDNTHFGGSMYCIKEEGRGDFKVVYRWALYEKLTNQVPYSSGLEAFDYDAAVVDYDPMVDILTVGATRLLDAPLKHPEFVSAPVIRGETAYVNAVWNKSIFGFKLPVTTTLAFNAHPGASEFFVTNPPGTFVLAQVDPDRTDPAATSYRLSALQPGLFDINKNTTTGVTRVTCDNMSATRRGQIQDCLAVNLPVIIRAGGNADIKVEPEATTGTTGTLVPGNAGGRWNPIRWYSTLNAFGTQASPLVTGNTLYMAGNSLLPNFIQGSGFDTLASPWGFMYAFDPNLSQESLLTITANRTWMNSNYGPRTWQKVFKSVTGTPGVMDSIRPAPELKWPSYYGIQNFEDFRIRTSQATLRSGQPLLGSIAGENQFIVWDAEQTFSFSQADFLFADAGRIGRIDAAGNPIWLNEATLKRGENARGNDGETVKMSRPWRVYPSGNSAYWVVDAGQDRIIRVDQSGRELRSISDIRIDPKYKPAGLATNSVKSLRMPRDLFVYSDVVLAAKNPFTNPQPAELWRHYLIADQGNYRIVELVDRYAYDATTGQTGNLVTYSDNGVTTPALGVVFGHSSPELSGKQFAYNSINRIVSPDGSSAVYAYGFGNIEPARSSFGLDPQNGVVSDVPNGYGGFVVWDATNSKQAVVTEFVTPGTPANTFYNQVTNAWDTQWTASQVHKIAGLKSVTMRYDSTGRLRAMITTSEGVFELLGDSTSSRWVCVWAMPSAAYKAIKRNGMALSPDNPIGFNPSFARRLDSGDILMVNSYAGSKLSGAAFNGEVIVVDGSLSTDAAFDPFDGGFNWNHRNLGFNTNSVKLAIPPAAGMRPLAQPVFADRR